MNFNKKCVYMSSPSYLHFDKSTYYWKKNINYREQPELYKIGKGEQGVLICQPYKDEICPFWRFKNCNSAIQSSRKIYQLFLQYLDNNEFVGADLARKFLQMGFTRAKRYANYKSGIKYDLKTLVPLMRGTGDIEKAMSAQIFFLKWKTADNNRYYSAMKAEWKKKYG